MNIFILDSFQIRCARFHCDKHVCKMIVETAQLLSNAYWATGEKGIYKETHKNHPCSLWVQESIENYMWLAFLGSALCAEYTWRYGKIHKCKKYIEKMAFNPPPVPNIPMTPFVLAMPEKYKIEGDAVQSYRNYYVGEKLHIAKWTRRKTPEWINVE